MEKVSAELLDEIVKRLVDEFDPEQIILFGSHAWGKPHADSDLDLFVVVSHSNETATRRAQRAHIRMHELPVPMDILVRTVEEVDRYRDVYTSLTAQVLEQGKVLYADSRTRNGARVAH